ncbi:uncharacterized protein LOC116294044 [Actinia tenebrosa]|uniref:Uncharacterized protein LOC116294044 n=1 Tax=Actinia tenebrosa TaxID=6105 RepID=A0A6P8HXN0_ACTTE|nr:uncharacterized protein LOC116294044 [Actinia tenebrosa]
MAASWDSIYCYFEAGFLESYEREGLKTLRIITCNHQETEHSASAPHSEENNQSSKESSYNALPEDEIYKFKTLLCILDRFSISFEGYHQLSQVNSSLPRSYFLEGCQKVIDAEWHDSITHTPGLMPGAELSFKTTLEKELKKR